MESLEQLLITQFLSSHNEATLFSSLPKKSKACLQTLVNLTSISHDAESAVLDDPHIRSYMTEYTAFKDGAQKGKTWEDGTTVGFVHGSCVVGAQSDAGC